MTIQRQYSLPNCTLLLEGLSETTGSNSPSDVRPVMSILVNTECRFAGKMPVLTGGREFFDSLVKAVSRYAQQFLSGIPHPDEAANEPSLVQLHPLERNLHRLVVHNRGSAIAGYNGTTTASGSTAPAPTVVDLTTVQLFDLVEAVDQFFADSQTLPDLSRNLVPIAKRHARSDQPVVERAAPVALGVSGLAVAAIAFFFIPVPEVQPPKDPQPQANSSSQSPSPTGSESASTGAPTPLPLATSELTPSPQAATSELTPSPQATTDALTPSPQATTSELTPSPQATTGELTPSPQATTDALTPSPQATTSELTPSPQATTPEAPASPSASTLENTSPVATTEISDPTLLRSLNQNLYEQVSRSWENQSEISQDLVYRVSVDQNGTIVGYKPINSAASNAVDKTPLLKLVQNPAATPNATPRAIADFKVVFTSRGVPQVSPWKGYPSKSDSGSTSEITNSAKLRDLNQRLYQQIQRNKKETLNFPDRLEYRVAVRSDGTVVDYEPQNQTASDYANQTPLPELKPSSTSANSTAASQEPLAYYKVVFTSRGVLQVSPWRGYR